jgi:succinate dehydrogenase subunit C
MAYVNPYTRPMGAWWRRNPYYGRYMVRELTCVFVTAYAVVLLVGLVRLAQGRAAYEAWRASLDTPAAVAFHAVTLVFMAYHAATWIAVMPKSMPPLRLGDVRIGDRAVIAAAAVASLALSGSLFLAVRGAGSP